MTEPEQTDPFAQLPDETDAQWRLRRHENPDDWFKLGDISLAEVREAIENGWPEARSNLTDEATHARWVREGKIPAPYPEEELL